MKFSKLVLASSVALALTSASTASAMNLCLARSNSLALGHSWNGDATGAGTGPRDGGFSY